jgi:hypothetical protein
MLRAVVPGLVVIACLAAPGASHAQSSITIRLYDFADRSAVERAGAIAAAAAIFDHAGLAIEWRDCGRNGADYPCISTRQPHDLIVRILPRAVAPDAPGSSAVTANSGADTVLRLGVAAVTDRGHGGIVATVYAEPVRDVTERTGVAFDLLLGRAIAHEVGHLFPGGLSRAESRGDGHSPTGLMRAVWTDDELRRGRVEDWAYFVDVTSERITRSSGRAVDGSNFVVPGRAPLD